MRVAIDLTALELDSGGTSRAVEGTLHELEAMPGLELVRMSHPESEVFGRKLGRIPRGIQRDLYYIPFQLPRNVARAEVDLLHCPAPLAPTRPRVPMVMTIHDLMVFDRPEWLSRGNVLQTRLTVPRAMRASSQIIVSSEYSRKRISSLLEIPRERMRLVPLGVDERFTPGPPTTEVIDRYAGDAPYVLTVGMLQPRKNLEGALQAFEQLVEGGAPHHLVVVGARGWDDQEIVQRVTDSPHAGRVHLCGHVSDAELVDLYRGADCFVFPSKYEGFGLPVLESMACGTPVISSDRTSLPEVAGDAAVLIDPDDQEQFNAELVALLDSPSRLEELTAKGIAHAAAFTWRRNAEQTLAAYEAALEHPL